MDIAPESENPTIYGSRPEDYLIRMEEQARAANLIEEARRRLGADAYAQLLLREALGMNPADARKVFGISEKAYKAARERIVRDIRSNAARPDY